MTTPVATRRPTQVSTTRRVRSRRGVSLVFATATMTLFLAAASFTLDAGRLQLARGELRRAADAAARAGAAGLEVSPAQGRQNAIAWSAKNGVDARPLAAGATRVNVGYWNAASHRFSSVPTGSQPYNAVQVIVSRPATGVDSVPLIFANLLHCNGVAIQAEAIAMLVAGENVTHQIDGVANPFLSGMPAGSVASLNNPHRSPDYAGNATSADAEKRRQSPPVVPLRVTPGQWISFDNIEGTVRHDPRLDDYQPDGQLDDVGHNTNGNENGVADVTAPIDSLVGVFLGDERPDRTAAPAGDPNVTSSASTANGRDFQQLRPANKQIFFIGDGVNSSGDRQRFQVPAGATRLYLATWDFYEWNNNSGYRIVRVSRPGSIVTVK